MLSHNPRQGSKRFYPNGKSTILIVKTLPRDAAAETATSWQGNNPIGRRKGR